MNSLAEGRLLADTRLCGLAQHETQAKAPGPRFRSESARAKRHLRVGQRRLSATLMQHGLFDEYRIAVAET
jgi:hypothetical protein